MIRDASETSSDEKKLNLKFDFDTNSILSYRKRYNIRHEGSAWSESNDIDFLIQIGALDDEGDDIRPTAAGLLMFGIERKITKEFPEYFLDYREHMIPGIRWSDRIYSQESEWSGNVFDFYSRVSAKLVLDIKKPFKLVNQVRVDNTPLHDAVREALVNCLVNADFLQPWSVVIEKYPDRIVMENPGTITTGKKQMLKGGISQPRNKIHFKMFNRIGLGEHAGSGVPDIYHAWKDAGFEDPIIEERFGGGTPDRTILILPFTQSANTDGKSANTDGKSANILKKRQLEIFEIMIPGETYSSSELGEKVGLGRSQMKKLLRELVDSGLLETQGNTRGRRYSRKE